MTPTDHAVFHLCSRAAANGALASGEYRADSLGQEGFIHLSRAHQVLPTAHAYFAGVPDVVVLVIDPTLLAAPLVYEPPAPLPSVPAQALPGANTLSGLFNGDGSYLVIEYGLLSGKSLGRIRGVLF